MNEVRECKECGCPVLNARRHKEWHKRVVTASGTTSTDPSTSASPWIGDGPDDA